MAHVVKITKKGNESGAAVLRRFSKAVKLSGLVRRARAIQYAKRKKSATTKKKDALKRIAYGKGMERERKLGKIA
ncbi:MAG: hypothetical protein HZA25_03630 [Candidatus Niyogibacteria bacterium]|nr:hypothetical protein [Candidatus Niyogibacteria bacterium]